VSLTRRFEEHSELGYVLAVDSERFLLLCVSPQIRLEGFSVLRTADVAELEAPHEHAEFVEEALRLRGESVETAPDIALGDTGAAIRSAAATFPLVTLHREEVDPDACHIGAVVRVTDDSVRILEIDPDADWEEEETTYALSEITRIDFGGGYEEALALVADLRS
jgi:hypothetical protein